MSALSEVALRAALDAGRVGYWTLDLQSFAFETSDSCKINFGRTPREPFSYAELVSAVHPDDQKRMRAAVARAIERDEDYDIEYRVLRPDGRTTWIHVRGRAKYDGGGRPLSMSGVSMDATGRKQTDEHLRLMVDELNHRVKNTLATVQSISRQSMRDEAVPVSVRESLDSRLIALAAAHDVLSGAQWSGAELREVARKACAPFGSPPTFLFHGPSVELTPSVAIALALAFHELSTNATKYGALSSPAGTVSVDWDVEHHDGRRDLRLLWREAGGPPVSPPTRRGFGSRLIERSLAAETGATVTLAFEPEGVVCTLRLPLARAVSKAASSRFTIARDGESWAVSAGAVVLQWFETQSDAISYVTDQLNALGLEGRGGTVVFSSTTPGDPPRRRRARLMET